MAIEWNINKYDSEMDMYTNYLERTDYIPMKLIEGVINPSDYAEVLEARQYAREKLGQLMNGDEPSDTNITPNPINVRVEALETENAELRETNQMLIDCILEMADIVYA